MDSTTKWPKYCGKISQNFCEWGLLMLQCTTLCDTQNEWSPICHNTHPQDTSSFHTIFGLNQFNLMGIGWKKSKKKLRLHPGTPDPPMLALRWGQSRTILKPSKALQLAQTRLNDSKSCTVAITIVTQYLFWPLGAI